MSEQNSVPLIYTKEGFVIAKMSLESHDFTEDGYFIIDSGCSQTLIDERFIHNPSHAKTIKGIGEVSIVGHKGYATIFCFNKSVRLEVLSISRGEIPSIRGYNIFGVIGVDFLHQSFAVLDFKRNTIYSANLQENSVADISHLKSSGSKRHKFLFFWGRDSHHLDCELWMLGDEMVNLCVDTGSSVNLINEDALVCANLSCKASNERIKAANLNKNFVCPGVHIVPQFLANQREKIGAGAHRVVTYPEELFGVLRECELSYCDGIIGLPFLRKHQFVIDFWQKTISAG